MALISGLWGLPFHRLKKYSWIKNYNKDFKEYYIIM